MVLASRRPCKTTRATNKEMLAKPTNHGAIAQSTKAAPSVDDNHNVHKVALDVMQAGGTWANPKATKHNVVEAAGTLKNRNSSQSTQLTEA